MSDRVAYVTPASSLQECMALMTEKRFRHLPVLDKDGSVIGMISIGDLVKETIREQQFLIDQLERYIAG
jgi:CBS domain-containing protein